MKKLLPIASLLVGLAGVSHAQLTINSPAGGNLPGTVSIVGGVVLDLIGTNNNRVVSQLAASSLFEGFYDDGTPVSFRGNPGTIGIQTGFNAGVLSALGGGLSEVAIRITLFDGDSSAGNFDFNDNSLLLNGFNFGNWSSVTTVSHNSTGTSFGSTRLGFSDNELVTGFFFSDNATLLSNFFTSLTSLNQVTYQVQDSDPFDNFYDFTQGVDAGLIDVGTGPVVTPPNTAVPEPSTYGLMGAAALLGAVVYRRRFASKKAA
jgi:hypothetical protein